MNLLQRLHADLQARRAALENPVGSGLVVVRCGKCKRPIATTAVDQAKGEPPILLDFPENAKGWTCSDCGAVRRQCVAMLFGWDPADYWNEKRCDRWFDKAANRKYCDDHLSRKCRRANASISR